MITPTARSMTLPRIAKSLNSSRIFMRVLLFPMATGRRLGEAVRTGNQGIARWGCAMSFAWL